VIATLGAKHKFIKPHCPWHNGRVERFDRTLQAEWAQHHVFTSGVSLIRLVPKASPPQ